MCDCVPDCFFDFLDNKGELHREGGGQHLFALHVEQNAGMPMANLNAVATFQPLFYRTVHNCGTGAHSGIAIIIYRR